MTKRPSLRKLNQTPICELEQTIKQKIKSEYEIKSWNKKGIEKQVETFLLEEAFLLDQAEEATRGFHLMVLELILLCLLF
jgi:hypothetical protein